MATEYISALESVLRFYLYLFQTSETKMEQMQLKILWQLLVENAFSQTEQNVFFSWLHSIFYGSRVRAKMLNMTPECIQLVFFEYLIKIDVSSFTN
jgi:transposase